MNRDIVIGHVIDCSRCGDFQIDRELADDIPFLLKDVKSRVLASHTIRKAQRPGTRFHVGKEFFEALKSRSLPSPAEANDNLLLWIAEHADGHPGTLITIDHSAPDVLGFVGAIEPNDLRWHVLSLRQQGFILTDNPDRPGWIGGSHDVWLTAQGWARVEELKRAHVASRFAFFARKFDNPDLDTVFTEGLQPAVKATGYELRIAPQRAGLVDAVIEDEIRRCRFLLADLSDDNSGAYWEAGFAWGLSKPVIYICRVGVKTHFDAEHRQTVQWDLEHLDETTTRFKAVIRNSLLGDAIQSD